MDMCVIWVRFKFTFRDGIEVKAGTIKMHGASNSI